MKTEQQEVNDMLEKALFTARNGLEETRRAMKALRAEPLEDLGLKLAFQNLVANIQARANLDIHLNLSDHAFTFSQDEEQMVYRIIQEALENIVHHAKAKNVWIDLAQNPDTRVLEIRDDGIGFDISIQNNKKDRLGLKGMRERAEMLNASLEINSKPGQGTLIQLKLRN
jgi:signal transduction histidine kinase